MSQVPSNKTLGTGDTPHHISSPWKGRKAVKCKLSEGQFEIHQILGFYYFMKAFKPPPAPRSVLSFRHGCKPTLQSTHYPQPCVILSKTKVQTFIHKSCYKVVDQSFQTISCGGGGEPMRGQVWVGCRPMGVFDRGGRLLVLLSIIHLWTDTASTGRPVLPGVKLRWLLSSQQSPACRR